MIGDIPHKEEEILLSPYTKLKKAALKGFS